MPLSKFFPCLQFRLDDNICKLDYSNNVLSDCFPQVWQYERTLEELNITSTRINYLPPQLFYCQGLKILLASNNSIDNIPEVVGSLRLLQTLNLNRNFISSVPDNIKSCKNLTHLDLSCNTLQKLPDAITSLISLQELLLNETCLEFLPANFGRLVNLRIIELRSNNLISLPKSMHRLNNLIRLDIGCNDFKVLPEVVGELKQLRELWFDSNHLEHFPSFLGKLRELVHCEASGNCFRDMPNELCEWINMELFSVSNNSLNKFSNGVGMLRALVTLKCENNLLTELPDSISMLENLEEIDVRHNMLSYLPNTIGLLRKLRYLFADDNNLRKIPDEICSCSALNILSISKNKISELPKNIGHLTHLKVLNIVNNNIKSLPITVLSLLNLTSLWISNNQSQPLIPLQYADITEKSELTCFLLPQIATAYQSLQKVSLNNIYEQKLSLNPESFDEQSANVFPKRRICFADKAIILNSTAQSLTSATTVPCTNDNSTKELHTLYDTNFNKNESRKVKKITAPPSKDLLMRSPTPYRKELRLMATLIKGNQNTDTNMYNKNNDELQYLNYAHQSDNEDKNINFSGETYQHKNNDNIRCNSNLSQENIFKNVQLLQHGCPGHKEKTGMNKTVTGKFSTAALYNNELNKTPLYLNLTQDLNYEKNNADNSTENSTTEILPNKSKILYSDIRLPNPNIVSRNNKKISTNKWLFGVHRNPRVFQIQISWENGSDIAVDFLPNKEGIYVVSTVPETNASNILFPYDKLLEVDGTDFTNISLDKARQVLSIPRPSISIMLSR